MGEPRFGMRRYTADEIAIAVAQYVEGASLQAAARSVGASHAALRYWLQRQGIPIRSIKEALVLKRQRIDEEVKRQLAALPEGSVVEG